MYFGGKWNTATNFKFWCVPSLFQPPGKRPRTRPQSFGQGLTGKPLAALMHQYPTSRQSWKEVDDEDDEMSTASSGEGKIESVQLVVPSHLSQPLNSLYLLIDLFDFSQCGRTRGSPRHLPFPLMRKSPPHRVTWLFRLGSPSQLRRLGSPPHRPSTNPLSSHHQRRCPHSKG